MRGRQHFCLSFVLCTASTRARLGPIVSDCIAVGKAVLFVKGRTGKLTSQTGFIND